MKRIIMTVLLLFVGCKPRTESAGTPEPVRMDNRRLPIQDEDHAIWNVACIDGVEYIWAVNVGITPKIRPTRDDMSPTFCAVNP